MHKRCGLPECPKVEEYHKFDPFGVIYTRRLRRKHRGYGDTFLIDEVETHERREGMFGSIYWWVVKLGMAAALAISGLLLNATGFDVALAGDQAVSTITQMRIFDAMIPFISSAIAIWMIALYPITEQKAHEVREQFEQRRGIAA